MQIIKRSILPCIPVLALLTSACSNLTPGENAAVAAGVVGTATGVALGCSGVNPAITIPVTLGAAALVAGGTYLYATNRATIDQRRIAEARVRLYYARGGEQQARSGRYLAVKTENIPQTQGEPVMLYDTQTGEAGNTVYDLKSTPGIGQPTTVSGKPATYIGSGR